MKNGFTILFFFLFFNTINAQLLQTIYQNYPVDDNVYHFQYNITDPHEFVVWQGSNVMLEINITYKGAPLNLIILAIKDGRYNILKENNNQTAIFKTNPRILLKNTSTNAIVNEDLFIRIYIPEEFAKISDTQWSRRDDIIADPRKPITDAEKNAVKVLYNPSSEHKISKIFLDKKQDK
jgi:hypothetical protein